MEYIHTRLKVAGAKNANNIFPQKTIKTIHNLSGGYPRMINVLADNALLYGYANGKKKISSSIITQCHKDMNLSESFSEIRNNLPNTPKMEKPKPHRPEKKWTWSMFSFLLILLTLGGLSYKYSSIIGDLIDGFSVYEFKKIPDEKGAQILVEKENLNETEKVIHPVKIEKPPILPLIKNENENTPINKEKPIESDKIVETLPTEDKAYFLSIIVNEGDTLAQLATNIYDRVDEDILNLIRENNPSIEDVNRIKIGQEIRFPSLSGLKTAPAYTVHIASYKPFDSARKLFQKHIEEGYEAYILPIYDPKLGKIYRVTIGHFQSKKEAENFASEILGKGVTDYAETMQLDLR